MGITIHFQGKLKTEGSFNKLVVAAQHFIVAHELQFVVFDVDEHDLIRVKHGALSVYKGPVKALIINMGKDCESLRFEFDDERYMQSFCKTAYAGPAVHQLVVDFLRQVEVLFDDFEVFDEAGVW